MIASSVSPGQKSDDYEPDHGLKVLRSEPDRSLSVEDCLQEYQNVVYRRTDQLFSVIFIFQWILGIAFAVFVTPRTWIGTTSLIHIHVWAAIFLGLAIIVPPYYFILKRPSRPETRHIIAIAQALTSVLLIHLTGGRIETHFHVFGSLAFLAMYRDWRILLTMTVIVAADHLVRGAFWPQSVYGIATENNWRWLEHAAWVIFEDIFLVLSCLNGQKEMRAIAERQTALSELNKTLDEKVIQRTEQITHLQSELIESDRMASLGQLAAGVAHEINNPIGFVMSNLTTLNKYTESLKAILREYQKLADEMRAGHINGNAKHVLSNIADLEKRNNLAFIIDDIDCLLVESKDGTVRVRDIVQGLKSFARIDEISVKDCNINTGIKDTLKIAQNELKYKCDVNLCLNEIPAIQCNPGQLNQVFLNLIINASQAIEDHGTISISTRSSDTHVFVEIEDTGSGISQDNLAKIFDPFFTTKPVGQGTGLGLAISYGIIAKHNGTIEVDSELGKGTTFTVKLPIQSDQDASKGATPLLVPQQAE